MRVQEVDVIRNKSIFNSEVQTLVNPVNCRGVMGAGLAMQFRKKYREMYYEYLYYCNKGLIRPGEIKAINLYKTDQHQWVLNFPTKLSWQQPSQIGWIEKGLSMFAAVYQDLGITSIAFPLLGAGLGGLQATQVMKLMLYKLSPVAKIIPVELYHYDRRV